MSRLFASDDQSIGALASVSVLLMNIQGWFPLGWTGLISLKSKELSRVFSITLVQKHQFFGTQPSLWSNSYICNDYWKKTELRLYRPLLTKWCLFFVICCLGLSQLSFQVASFNFMAVVTVCSDFWSPRKWNLLLFHFIPFCLLWSDRTRCQDLHFFNAEI